MASEEESKMEELEARDREIFMSERREDIGALIIAGIAIAIVLVLLKLGVSIESLEGAFKKLIIFK